VKSDESNKAKKWEGATAFLPFRALALHGQLDLLHPLQLTSTTSTSPMSTFDGVVPGWSFLCPLLPLNGVSFTHSLQNSPILQVSLTTPPSGHLSHLPADADYMQSITFEKALRDQHRWPAF
jgi:hypothetical protein